MLLELKQALQSLTIYIISLFLLNTGGCTGPTTFGQRADSLFLITDQSEIYYDLKNPEEKYFLPYVLSEISGLSYLMDNQLITVEDEGSRVFIYDLVQKDIVHSIKFHNPGDYEGVEVIDGEVFVLESDGDVYRFPYGPEKEVESEKSETPLDRKNDTEGLGYDPLTGQLLIACKEDGDIKGTNAKGKAVYAFDIEEEELDDDPRFEISLKTLKKFFEANRDQQYDEERLKFKPSGIAYHPIEQAFYIIASTGKLMVVLTRDGIVKATYPIAPRLLGQPEGICFAPNGDLYISSEGEGDRGYILKFKMKRK